MQESRSLSLTRAKDHVHKGKALHFRKKDRTGYDWEEKRTEGFCMQGMQDEVDSKGLCALLRRARGTYIHVDEIRGAFVGSGWGFLDGKRSVWSGVR